MKILCIGEALIDMICTDKGSSLVNGEHFLKKPGGAPTNVAAAIAAFGGKVTLAARVGDDAFGKQLVAVLEGFGVSTEAITYDQDHFTTLAFVSLMEDGERDFVFSRGADGFLSKGDIDKIDLSEVAIIHFGSATAFLPGPLRDAYFQLLRKALQRNIFISFDPNFRPLLFPGGSQEFTELSWEFLCTCNFFKLSEPEALLITNANTIDQAVEQLMDKTGAVFCITLGKEGSLLRVNNNLKHIAPVPAAAIDTTGAGDAFTGAVLYQLQQHPSSITGIPVSDWERIVANANKAGARTCEYLGAMEAYKQLDNRAFD